MARCTRPGPHPATPSATHSSFTVCGVYVWKKPQDRHFPSCCLLAPPPAYRPPPPHPKSAGSSRPTRWLRCFKLPSHVSAVFLCGPGCSQYAGVLCLAYVVFSGNLSQNVKTRELYRCVGPHSCRAATPGGTGPSHRGGARSSSLPCRGPPPPSSHLACAVGFFLVETRLQEPPSLSNVRKQEAVRVGDMGSPGPACPPCPRYWQQPSQGVPRAFRGTAAPVQTGPALGKRMVSPALGGPFARAVGGPVCLARKATVSVDMFV